MNLWGFVAVYYLGSVGADYGWILGSGHPAPFYVGVIAGLYAAIATDVNYEQSRRSG